MRCFTVEELKDNMKHLPANKGGILIMRHSIRHEIPSNQAYGFETYLTDEGLATAEHFGKAIKLPISHLASSPLYRCIQTAEAIVSWRPKSVEVVCEPLVGATSCYITGLDEAAEFLKLHGGLGMVNDLLAGKVPPGMVDIKSGTRQMCELIQANKPGAGNLAVYVTHDSVLGPFIYDLLGFEEISDDEWPKTLESCLVWFEEELMHFVWRGEKRVVNIREFMSR